MNDLRMFIESHGGDEARGVLAFMETHPEVRPSQIAEELDLMRFVDRYPITCAFLAGGLPCRS